MLELVIAFAAGAFSAVAALYWIMKAPKGPTKAELDERREPYRRFYEGQG